VDEQLRELIEAARATPELEAMLANPELDSRAKADVIAAVLKDADELVRNFALLVIEKGRGAELDEIVREYSELVRRAAGSLSVELTTAVELAPKEAKGIVDQIGRATGRTVETSMKVDPDLIGGVVMQVGSMRVDASVRGRLERLRRELRAGA
jgi:F-type H+-transporting ATPase subunit delta